MPNATPPQLYLEDLPVGLSFAGGPWSMNDRRFGLFAEITGDSHPIHYSDDYVKRHTLFERRLAHGLLLAAMTALGATPMSARLETSMVALVEERMRFVKPVFVDDAVASRFSVAAVERRPGSDRGLVTFDVRLINQQGAVVVEGTHSYLIRARQQSEDR